MFGLLSRGQSGAAAFRSLTSAARVRVPNHRISPIVMAARKNSTVPEGYREDHSKGPMLRFQESLPKLPVPTLQQTAETYVKSLQPILSAEELARSKAAVEEFIRPGGQGEKLQSKLLAKAADPNVKNWMIDWWNNIAYLGYRDPVVPYVSYFYSYKDDKKRRNPAKRAAAITTGALKFKKMVDEGTLEPEYMRKQPLCMDSYQYMFNCSRIPEKPVDYPKKYDTATNKHFVVARKGQFFKVLHEVNGQQLSAVELEAQFNRVLELADGSAPQIGALTSENRDIWTDARNALLEASPENAAALEIIESASFVVSLDDASPVTYEERAHAYWHGDGKNRFYDKPLHFIVNDNGTAGFLGEHSMMDGTPTHRLNDYINDQIFNNKLDYGATQARSNLPEPKAINFVVNEKVEEFIDTAVKDFRKVIGAHELSVLSYPGYGKGLIKKFKCSPDAYTQMVIQLAYYKMYGKNRPTYESAATRKFQLGRTETCRTVSDESVAWCKAMEDPEVDAATCVKLLRDAVNAHVKYISKASDGFGCDRHLFGLKQCLTPSDEVPSIFKDPAYSYSSSWYISSSQLSSEYFNGYGWSQVIDDGFGIAYMINENSLQFNIVSKKLGTEKMKFYLVSAAEDMRAIMETELEEPKAKL